MKRQFLGRRGNALVEFGLCAPLAIAIMAGTFQFGYGFYVYDQLQLAVRSGVRYGSLVDYKGTSSTCTDAIKTSVKSVTVYGTPTPDASATPVVRGLSTSNVTVSYNVDTKSVPTMVTASISDFSVNAGFTTFTFNQKPYAAVPYTGRYSPAECQ